MLAAVFLGLGIGAIVGGVMVLFLGLFRPGSIKYPGRARWMGGIIILLGILLIASQFNR